MARRPRARAAIAARGQTDRRSTIPAVEAIVENEVVHLPRHGEIPLGRHGRCARSAAPRHRSARRRLCGTRVRCRRRGRRRDAGRGRPARSVARGSRWPCRPSGCRRRGGRTAGRGSGTASPPGRHACRPGRRSTSSWRVTSQGRAQPSPCIGMPHARPVRRQKNRLAIESETAVRDAIGERHQRIARSARSLARSQRRGIGRAQEVDGPLRSATAKRAIDPPDAGARSTASRPARNDKSVTDFPVPV